MKGRPECAVPKRKHIAAPLQRSAGYRLLGQARDTRVHTVRAQCCMFQSCVMRLLLARF